MKMSIGWDCKLIRISFFSPQFSPRFTRLTEKDHNASVLDHTYTHRCCLLGSRVNDSRNTINPLHRQFQQARTLTPLFAQFRSQHRVTASIRFHRVVCKFPQKQPRAPHQNVAMEVCKRRNHQQQSGCSRASWKYLRYLVNTIYCNQLKFVEQNIPPVLTRPDSL